MLEGAVLEEALPASPMSQQNRQSDTRLAILVIDSEGSYKGRKNAVSENLELGTGQKIKSRRCL